MIHVIAGGIDVAVAGTRVALSATRVPACWVSIQAKTANTGRIFIGDSSVSSTDFGVELKSLEEYTFPPVSDINLYDLKDIYIDASVSGEGVTVIYATH